MNTFNIAKGYCLIQEVKLPESTTFGIVLGDKERRLGVIGKILSVNNDGTWLTRLFGFGTPWKKDQIVLYSQYLTQEACILDEKGILMKSVWLLPVYGVFGAYENFNVSDESPIIPNPIIHTYGESPA